MYTTPDPEEQIRAAELRAANVPVLGAEAKAREVFEMMYCNGSPVQQAVASTPIKKGGPRVVARYRGTAPTMFEVFEHGCMLVIQFANRDACVEFVRERMFAAEVPA